MRRVALIGVVVLLVAACQSNKHPASDVAVIGSTPVADSVAVPVDVHDQAHPGALTTNSARASISGVLWIPATWGMPQVELCARRIEPPVEQHDWSPRVHIGPGTKSGEFVSYEWRTDATQTGQYSITSVDPLFVTIVNLEPGGTSAVAIRIPPPAAVSVLLTDARTNKDVRLDRIQWHPVRTIPRMSMSAKTVFLNADTGTYDFMCPVGEVTILTGALDHGYLSSSQQVGIRPGNNTVVMPLTSATCARLTLTEADRTLPLNGSIFFTLIDAQGEPNYWPSSWDGTTAIIAAKGPGRYRVSASRDISGQVTPDGDAVGYLPPAEQIVDLKEGTMTDVVIRLTRKP